MASFNFDSQYSACTCHIVIVGGGLSGLAAAIGLRQAGHEVTILERMPEFMKVGAGVNLPPNASKALNSLGVLTSIESFVTKPNDIFLHSYRDGSLLSHVNLVPDIQTAYEASYLSIHRSTLHDTLLKKATEAGVIVRLGVIVAKIDFAEPSVHLTSDEILRGDLVLGADGENSQCRELLLGQPDPPFHAGDFIFALDIKHDVVSQTEGVREFLDPPNIDIWFGPDAHIVVFSLKRDQMLHVIGSRRDPNTNLVQARPQLTDINEMRHYFRDWDPRLKKLLDLAEYCLKWTLTATTELHKWSHISGKFSLLGDSAHAMTPYLAQGAAQGIEDAVVLATMLAHISDKAQIPDIIAMYEGLRKPHALKLKCRSLEMREINSMRDGPLQQERDLQCVQREPFEGYPIPWADPVFQKWMYGYDACEEATKAWDRYVKEKKP